MRLAWRVLGVVLWFVYLAAASLVGEGEAQAAEPSLCVGVAVVDITPPVGYRMEGYFSERPSTGTHDPLQARAIVLRQGNEQAALVVCDLCALDAAVTGQARAQAEKKMGIPAAHILIAATHTHTGPLYFNALRDHFHAKAVAAGGSDPREKIDYPYYLEQTLRQSLGDQLVSVFANGTCGDINHFDVSGRQTLKTKYIGETLAATVKASLPGLKHLAQPRLAVRSEVVELPLRTYTADEVALAEKAMDQMGTGEKPFMDMVKAYEIMSFKARKPGKLPALVQAIRLDDDTALVGLPGEVFVELGLAIKKASPFANTMVVELSLDCPDYVPTRKAFQEGSYETVCSWIEPGGGELLVDSAMRLLKDLKP